MAAAHLRCPRWLLHRTTEPVAVRAQIHPLAVTRCTERQELRLAIQTDSRRCLHQSVVVRAKPNARLPKRTVKVLCSGCRTALYKYHKNGNGKLVKCWHERIAVDYTNKDLKCPNCGQEFARPAMIRGLPANKIISGKVIMK